MSSEVKVFATFLFVCLFFIHTWDGSWRQRKREEGERYDKCQYNKVWDFTECEEMLGNRHIHQMSAWTTWGIWVMINHLHSAETKHATSAKWWWAEYPQTETTWCHASVDRRHQDTWPMRFLASVLTVSKELYCAILHGAVVWWLDTTQKSFSGKPIVKVDFYFILTGL